jgi:hypothetical protein
MLKELDQILTARAALFLKYDDAKPDRTASSVQVLDYCRCKAVGEPGCRNVHENIETPLIIVRASSSINAPLFLRDDGARLRAMVLLSVLNSARSTPLTLIRSWYKLRSSGCDHRSALSTSIASKLDVHVTISTMKL